MISLLLIKNVELTNKYQIKQVPTLVVESNESVEKYNNFSNIVKYING
jgi:ribosome-binding factor A